MHISLSLYIYIYTDSYMYVLVVRLVRHQASPHQQQLVVCGVLSISIITNTNKYIIINNDSNSIIDDTNTYVKKHTMWINNDIIVIIQTIHSTYSSDNVPNYHYENTMNNNYSTLLMFN